MTNLAKIISDAELNVLQEHLLHLTKRNPVHQRTLFSEVKPYLEITQDFSTFCRLINACIEAKRLVGFKFVKGGCLDKDSAEDIPKEEIPKTNNGILKIHDVVISISGIADKAIRRLLIDVFDGKEDKNGSVEYCGLKYTITNESAFKNFLNIWYGK